MTLDSPAARLVTVSQELLALAEQTSPQQRWPLLMLARQTLTLAQTRGAPISSTWRLWVTLRALANAPSSLRGAA